jgi:hypothetical protein
MEDDNIPERQQQQSSIRGQDVSESIFQAYRALHYLWEYVRRLTGNYPNNSLILG